MDMKCAIWLIICTSKVFVFGISEPSPPPHDVEHFLMVKMNGSDVFPCILQMRPAPVVGKKFEKRRDIEEFKEIFKGPSTCAKCVACAAMVFGLIREFAKGKPSVGDDELDVVCDRKMPLYRIWDVSGIRYFGEPTVSARQVLIHEHMTPSIQTICQQMKNMTTGRQLHDVWRQDESKFMNRLCFNPYFHPGLASCRGILKRTKGVDRINVCGFMAYIQRTIFFWDKNEYCYCKEEEYRLVLAWHTLGNNDEDE